MKTEDFIQNIVQPRLELCKELLGGSKDKEYSRNGDKFHNFKRTAELRKISTISAWDGMQNKHLTSLLDIIDDAKKGILPTQKTLDDKITDMINYLLLLEGIITEKRNDLS